MSPSVEKTAAAASSNADGASPAGQVDIVTTAPAEEAKAGAAKAEEAVADEGAEKAPSSTSPPATPASSAPASPERTRNQAPGIPDRRRSTRPSPSGRATRGNRKGGGGASKRVSCIGDMASELRLKADDDDDHDDHDHDDKSSHDDDKSSHDDDKSSHSDNKSSHSESDHDKADNDTFEDATSTPRPASAEPGADAGADADAGAGATADKTQVGSSAPDQPSSNGGGLGISGVDGSAGGEEKPPPPEVSSEQEPRSLSPTKQRSSPPGSPVKITHGLSGDVALPTQPPPSSAERRQNLESRGSGQRVASSPPPHPGFARKASTGFGALLGRMGSIRKPARSPPASRQDRSGLERRMTSTSLASMEGNGAMGVDGGKPSLQDQFSDLRRKEEFGTPETNGHILHEQDEHAESPQASVNGAASPPGSPPKDDARLKSPTNTSLPPGTASGMSAGPPPDPVEVNWDLWQQLVYEGPLAVARTSGDEMNVAITAGIPPAIRGVVWQVLAESKNEELENVYRILKARGTDADHRPHGSRAGSTVGTISAGTDKDGTSSDASSEHSHHSTSATSGVASPPTSVDIHVPELQSKLLAEKQKREAASLQKLEKAIKRDMGTRTSYSKYTQSAGLQDGLFGVCKAYALFDEGVGYAQGINFIAMPLLFNMAEEEAFTLLVRLMSKYDLRSMFTPDMRGLHLRLYQFERLLEEHEPAVYCHLKRRNVEPQLYATQWFLTLFVYRFPLQLVLRIYDLIFSEGLTAILKFGIVLIQHNRQALLEIKDMAHLTNFLKEKLFDVYIDKSPSASSLLDSGFFGSVTGGADKELYRADDMVRDACTIKISDQTLKAYSIEWEEAERVRRERQMELETLRISNASLTSRIKALEERAQQHDTEHVTMAQDLVKIKVENDALQDANEGLKFQVVELQKMVDKQPEEVETRLKEEMDRIMQRNIEVQNENRNLKEEMDEMEHELVNAKVAHAQSQADHETLKKKLTSVQAMLSEKQ